MASTLHNDFIGILSTYSENDARMRLEATRKCFLSELDRHRQVLESQYAYASQLLTLLEMPEDTPQHQEAIKTLERLKGGEFSWRMI